MSNVDRAIRRLRGELGDGKVITDADLLAPYAEDAPFSRPYPPDAVARAESSSRACARVASAIASPPAMRAIS